MYVIPVILTLVPVIICAFLLIKVKMQTVWCALITWILMMIIALTYFDTPMPVALRSSLHGAVTSLPMAMMVCTSIFQVAFMESTGAIKRIGVFLKTISPGNVEARTMIVNVGACTSLNSVGANPLSFLPPILRDLGYSKILCIALPAIGFDALCTYSMMAAPLVVFSDLTGVSLTEAAKYFSMYLPVVSTLICMGMFFLIGGGKMLKKGFWVALVAGMAAGWTAFAIAHIPVLEPAIVLTGVIAGVVVICVMLIYCKGTKTTIIDRSLLTEEDKEIERSMSLGKALSPWIILIVCLLLVAFIPPLNEFLKVQLEGAIDIIPTGPAKTRVFWNAYFWVVVSTLLSFIILRPTRAQLGDFMKRFGRRWLKPTMTSVIFFAVGLVMNYSGFQVLSDGSWELSESMNNMVYCLSNACAETFGALYPLIVPPLGLFGGFVTTSEASALAMFSPSNLQTAAILHINGPVLAAATGVAGGLASVISPGKLVNSAATIDAMGQEGEVIKKTFPIAIVLMLSVIVLAMIFSKVIAPV